MDNLLENLSLNKFYKVIVYIAGFILIASIFLDVKSINIDKLRAISFVSLVAGLLSWAIDYYITTYLNIKIARDELSESELKEILSIHVVINLIIYSLTLIFILR